MSETNPLLNKESVQGLAKHIEGLLNSKGVISKSQKKKHQLNRKNQKRKPKIIKKFNNKLKLNLKRKLQFKKKHPKRMLVTNKKPIYTKLLLMVKRLMLTLKN